MAARTQTNPANLHSAEDSLRVFSTARSLGRDDLPAKDERILDLALLDMHHGWPNLGHDSIVRSIGEIAKDLAPLLETAGLRIRVISYDIRQRHAIPEPAGGRHALYIGTGGPGHIDPHLNDGIAPFSQGIHEDASWERPLFRLFDSIRQDEDSTLLAVCHSFGVLCRWSGIATPVLRGQEKGGKSTGIVQNVLTSEADSHPWFKRFADQLPDRLHFPVLDSRLFDLIPSTSVFSGGTTPISFEANAGGGAGAAAITMVEFARDCGGVMPRILAVNHHPEIRDRLRQMRLLNEKLARGEVSVDWYNERASPLRQFSHDRTLERSVMLTSQFTLIAPLRFHIYRLVRKRAALLGCGSDLHESQVLQHPSAILDREEDGSL